VLAQSAATGSALWPLLLGSAITLVSTLLAQWTSLAYQTRRQREARRADLQRTTLVQLRDALDELGQGIQGVFVARGEALERTGDWSMLSYHPTLEAVRSAIYRVRLLATALENEPLRSEAELVTRSAFEAAMAPTQRDADEQREKMSRGYFEVVELLGEQLRRLP
jgi:hypothetical protein